MMTSGGCIQCSVDFVTFVQVMMCHHARSGGAVFEADDTEIPDEEVAAHLQQYQKAIDTDMSSLKDVE